MAKFILKDLGNQIALIESGGEVWRVAWVLETLLAEMQQQADILQQQAQEIADLQRPRSVSRPWRPGEGTP